MSDQLEISGPKRPDRESAVTIPSELPICPLRDTVLFPNSSCRSPLRDESSCVY